jgi:fatty acid desaturase (delta-4 desaturase)
MSKIYENEKDLSENVIAIDGIVYSIDGWEHPGGDQIRLFGGNDVSVQYRMIHTFHNKYMINKMPKIGILKNYRNDYHFDTDFEKELKEEVRKIVKPSESFATFGFKCRCLFYCSMYFILIINYVINGGSLILCTSLGITQAFIGLNVQHDANHGAISKKPFWNDLLGYGADLIGGSKYLWIQQHWTHHAFTNDIERDPDAKSTEPFFIFHNYQDNSIRRSIHAFQHLWMIPILSLYWTSSICSPEVLSLNQKSVSKYSGINFNNSYVKNGKIISWTLRVIYISCICISPIIHHGYYNAIFIILYMSIVESLTLAIPFAISHNFEESERFPIKEKSIDWYKSQVETSSTYGGKIEGYLTGGLNFQIEHHLFPRMSSAWYPYIQPVVKKVCDKHGIRYTYYPTIFHNILSTLKYIKNVGIGIKKNN